MKNIKNKIKILRNKNEDYLIEINNEDNQFTIKTKTHEYIIGINGSIIVSYIGEYK